jgi:DNA-binding GntR family transcriptional regulator
MTGGPDPRKWVQVTTALRGQITSGDLPSGSAVPAAAGLARTHSVHRTTVLRAFRELAAQDLIHYIPGHGYYVS